MRHIIVILLLSIFLTLIFTFPLILKFSTSIPGFHSTDEPYGTLWNFWWLKFSHFHHINAYFCSTIASPFSLDLSQSPMYPVSDFINRYLTIGFGEIVAYNLEILASFVLTAIFMYLLTYSLTANRLAALFSCIIFSFCPYHIVRAWQHPSLAQIQWFPLYILSLYKLKKEATVRNIAFCVISFSLVTLFNYYYAYFSFIVMFAFAVFIFAADKKIAFGDNLNVRFSVVRPFLKGWESLSFRIRKVLYTFLHHKKGSLKIIKSIFISMGITFLLLSPIILPIFKKAFFTPKTEELVAGGYLRQFSDLFEQSAKPLSYFLPPTVHPVFGKFTEQFIGSSLYGMSFTEHTLYLGWIPLILAFIAFKGWRKRRKEINKIGTVPFGESPYRDNFYIGFFIFLAIVAWIFSQPPWWKIGPLKIYMPSFFMYKILPMFRAYCRFGVIVMLAVSVLAGFGLKFILERLKSRKVRIAVTSLFCSLVLFEFWNWPPYKVIDVSNVPAVYYWLKEQPGTFAIAEYPLDADSTNEMYKFYQTVHEKKIINGTIPGTYANKFAQAIRRLSQPETAGALKWMGVEYALVHWQGYKDTGLVDDSEELNKIPQNPGLKFIKSFSSQECPHKDRMCVQRTSPIDVYEVIAPPIEPVVKD